MARALISRDSYNRILNFITKNLRAIYGNLKVNGKVTADEFHGDGSNLTGVGGAAIMESWVLEDGDGTEVTITEAKEVKFVEGTGIDIDWTDTSTGSDGDPYDLTFTCNLEGTELVSTGEGGASKFLREDGDGTCSWQTVSTSVTVPLALTNASDGGGAALTIANNDIDQIALDINAANTTANIIDIVSNDVLTTGKALHIDVNNGTTTALTPTYMHFDFDKDGVVGDGVTSTFTGWDIDMNDAATNHANANVTMTGLDVDLVSANAQGTLTNVGASILVTGADTNTGLDITTTDGSGPDIKIMSSANTGDYFSIATTTNGATTIATVDADAAVANLVLDVDGAFDVNVTADVTIDTAASVHITSTEDVVNAISLASNNIYFSGGDQDNAYLFYSKPIYLDVIAAPASVTGKLWNESGYLLTWGGLGFQTIGSGHFNTTGADYDFRVQSNNQTHAFFVDGGNDEIQINSRTAVATGGGFDGAAGVTLYVSKVNGEIITTILVDIEGLVVSGTAFDIIGENSVAAAYITQITTAVNGIIYRAEMACIEAPAGTNTTADIDLGANNSSKAEDAKYTQGGGAIALIAAGEAWTAGMYKTTTAGTDFSGLADDYLYLANGSGANSGGTYTAGKFIIKLYGAGF